MVEVHWAEELPVTSCHPGAASPRGRPISPPSGLGLLGFGSRGGWGAHLTEKSGGRGHWLSMVVLPVVETLGSGGGRQSGVHVA